MCTTNIKPVADYAGLFDPETVPYNKNVLHVATGVVQPDRLFSVRYQVIPCTLSLVSSKIQSNYAYHPTSKYLHATSIVQHLITKYQVNPNAFISHMCYDSDTKLSYYNDVYIDLGNYLAIYLSGGHIFLQEMENPSNLKPDTQDNKFVCFTAVQVSFIPQVHDQAVQILDDLSKFNLFVPIETCLLMVCSNPQSGFYTSNITIKQPIIKDFQLNYGDEFPAVHEKLITQLCKANSTGITFLHGPPGTGKTYYIRYLINEIKEKMLIYVPPDLVNEITKPGFLPFLMQHPDSILIIEDAENIILDRKETINPNQAVSNLLNLSDGLLGDAMRLQIITTFNCEIKSIDPALLRQGRLVVEHKFDKLPVKNARRLCNELNIKDGDEINQPMSLAEIYAKIN